MTPKGIGNIPTTRIEDLEPGDFIESSLGIIEEFVELKVALPHYWLQTKDANGSLHSKMYHPGQLVARYEPSPTPEPFKYIIDQVEIRYEDVVDKEKTKRVDELFVGDFVEFHQGFIEVVTSVSNHSTGHNSTIHTKDGAGTKYKRTLLSKRIVLCERR